MKPANSKGQLRLAAGGALVLGAGALGWWGLGLLGERQMEVQALSERMGNPALAALLGDPAGVARAARETVEIQKLDQEIGKNEGALSRGWAKETILLSGEGQEWSQDPGKWKDRLVAIQSELLTAAPGHRVSLAPDFYLGLDAFRQKSPTAAEVPALAMHLSVAKRLVELLFQARKVPEQYPTPCEFRMLSGPGSVAEKAPEPPAGAPRPRTAPPEAERKSFRLEIRCSPEVLYEYVKLLSGDPALFILSDLSVLNEKQTFPLRSEIAKKFAVAQAPVTGSEEPASAQKRLLEILAGEESLLATLELDFVAWREPDPGKNPSAPVRSP